MQVYSFNIDSNVAKEVTFHPQVKMKSVTLDGDVYDPSGSLTGGSQSSSGRVLLKMRKLKVLKTRLEGETKELENVTRKLDAVLQESAKFSKTIQAIDLKEHQLKLLEQQLESNASVMIIKRVEEIKREISEIDQVIKENDVKYRQAIEKQKSLEIEIDELTNNRDSKIKSIEVF